MAIRNKKELQIYFVDISARMSQVIFTLLIITPFIANIFNWTMLSVGLAAFIVIVLLGAVVASSIEEAF